MGETRKPGGGRKKLKPEYDAGKNLKEQMDAAVSLYKNNSLQAIADALELNPIKVRKLLITAGVYESDMAETVQHTFYKYRDTQCYKESHSPQHLGPGERRTHGIAVGIGMGDNHDLTVCRGEKFPEGFDTLFR